MATMVDRELRTEFKKSMIQAQLQSERTKYSKKITSPDSE